MDEARAGRELARRVADLTGIARRFIATRQACGLTNAQLSAKSGIAVNTISMWEHARRRPSLDQLAMVIPILGVSLDWVYFGDDSRLPWEIREAIFAELPNVVVKPAWAGPETGTDRSS